MRKVLFACVHNAGRSQIAAAFFNAAADPDKARAFSAGTEPAEQLHPAVLEAMREIGLDLSERRPTGIELKEILDVHYLVTMGCGQHICPVIPAPRREDWPLPDLAGQPLDKVRKARDEIRTRVRALVDMQHWNRQP